MFYRVRQDKSGWEPRRLFTVVEFMMRDSRVRVDPSGQRPSSAVPLAPPTSAVPRLGSCASSGRAWRLQAARHFPEEAGRLPASAHLGKIRTRRTPSTLTLTLTLTLT